MVEMVQDEVTQQDIFRWYELKQELNKIKNEEHVLRMRIYKHLFKDPKEGTNKHQLGDGYVLNANRTIERKIDIAALDQLKETLKDLPLDVLIRYKPELSITEFRKLEGDELARFQQVLIIKDGSPQMDVVLPAAVAKAKVAAEGKAT